MTKQWVPLTDSQWDAISPFFNTKRKRTLNLRTVLDAIFYLLRTGCQWRNLPAEHPDWQAVYYYFDQWKQTGVYQRMNDELNKLDRMNEVRDATPSALCADSQSVDLAPMIFEDRGLDPNKKVNGGPTGRRKRQWLVDMGGRLWRTVVHAANGADGPSAKVLLDNLDEINHRLDLFFGDMAYNGVFADAVVAGGYRYEKAAKPESKQGFVPVKGRWVVERSISWTNFFRRIVKDYEYTTSSSEAFLYLANSLVMLQRIDKQWGT